MWWRLPGTSCAAHTGLRPRLPSSAAHWPMSICVPRIENPQVAQALATMKEPARELLLLTYWDSFTAEEIAVILDSSPGAIRVRLHRARKAFATALASDSALQLSSTWERRHGHDPTSSSPPKQRSRSRDWKSLLRASDPCQRSSAPAMERSRSNTCEGFLPGTMRHRSRSLSSPLRRATKGQTSYAPAHPARRHHDRRRDAGGAFSSPWQPAPHWLQVSRSSARGARHPQPAGPQCRR